MKKNSYRKWFVWQASVDRAVQMIELGDRLIEQRRYALADQLVRAACSVPNNVAEGQGRITLRDRRHFHVQARGSLYELETQLEILERANLVTDTERFHDPICKITAGLTTMINSMAAPAPSPL